MNLNQVTVPAFDLPASIAFYTQLGLKLIVRSASYARFACPAGKSTFSVQQLPRQTGVGATVVYFETPDLDAVVARLQHAGLAFEHPPRDEPWLWREARLLDPAGNAICLYWAGRNRLRPPWRMGA